MLEILANILLFSFVLVKILIICRQIAVFYLLIGILRIVDLRVIHKKYIIFLLLDFYFKSKKIKFAYYSNNNINTYN